VEALGAGGGALVGTALGPAGTVGGAGLGYGIAKELLELGDVYLGDKAPRQGAAQVIEPVRNVLEGATFETAGRVAAPLISKGAGKLMDLRKIPQKKAGDIARNALGPDLPEALNLLKSCRSEQVKARVIELLNKMAGNLSDQSNTQVNIFQGMEAPKPISIVDTTANDNTQIGHLET
jgi:hypothetical protein